MHILCKFIGIVDDRLTHNAGILDSTNMCLKCDDRQLAVSLFG